MPKRGLSPLLFYWHRCTLSLFVFQVSSMITLSWWSQLSSNLHYPVPCKIYDENIFGSTFLWLDSRTGYWSRCTRRERLLPEPRKLGLLCICGSRQIGSRKDLECIQHTLCQVQIEKPVPVLGTELQKRKQSYSLTW